MAVIARSWPLIRRHNLRYVSTSIHLHQDAQLAEPSPHTSLQTPLPPNPASGSPLYNENWRSPLPSASSADAVVIPISLGFLHNTSTSRMQSLSKSLDGQSLMNHFADWMTSQRWDEMKHLFEFWIRSLDKNGKPNKPDVNLYNHYLRANLMIGTSAGELLDLVAQMEDYGIVPNTASYNLVFKAMKQAGEAIAAEKLIESWRIKVKAIHRTSLLPPSIVSFLDVQIYGILIVLIRPLTLLMRILD